MPRSPSKGKKSPGRGGKSPGRAPAAKKKTAPAAAATADEMEFSEGDNVMARWPGTNLFFKAKITYVRDDDEEYDVQYEDGTVFTIKAKDVKRGAALAARKKTPTRSRSRGRSPGRRKSPARAPASAKKTVESPSPKKRSSRSSQAAAAAAVAKISDTPGVRTSARIAAKLTEMSSDDERPKLAPNPAHPRRGKTGFFANLNFEWLSCLFFMVLGPVILISLHTLCTATTCKLAVPTLPKVASAYWDRNAFLTIMAFIFSIRFLSMVPVGSTVKAINGHNVRMNGFIILLGFLAMMPVLVYKKVNLSFITDKYFYLMTSSVMWGVVNSIVVFIISRWGKKSNANSKGNTGNVIVDFFHGRELNPFFMGVDVKLATFRCSMIALAMLNAALVTDKIMKDGGVPNPVVVVASAFQIIYALDAMFFEEFYFFSHDAMNAGFGYSLNIAYASFPFLPTLITRYLIARNPTMPWYYLLLIGLVNALGYMIFRSSENQRCLFSKDQRHPALKHLETIPAAAGKKILAGGWWSLVRHPNHLGEILLQWSWVLPAACRAGRTDLLVYYLPIFATLVLLVRCSQQNTRNRRKYGTAWDTYCNRVPANIIPKVY